MKKTLLIDGMMCEHCALAVKSALESVINNDSIKINLKKKTAIVKTDIDDKSLIQAVESAGYKVISVK